MSHPIAEQPQKRFRGLLLTLVATFFVACGPDHKTEDVASPKEMQQTLEKSVTKGMGLDAAKAFMEREGFFCEDVKGGTWKGRKGLNFLHCKREDGQMIKRRWEVALMHDGKSVSSLELRTALVYP
jgi:hypothetical protein